MLDSKHRGRRKGVPVRPGSVREAREAAGLSLAEVADGELSRTAIHLIEHGKVKPSLETLHHIARKTRKPIGFFLEESAEAAGEQPPELQELERLNATRQFAQVIELGAPLLGSARSDALATVQFLVGQAYCRLVQPDNAIDLLRQSRAYFERVGDEWMAVEALDWEAATLGLLEDPEAMPLANEALNRCRKLDPMPTQTEARILGHVAAMHLTRQSWAQAVRYYEAAVEAAGGVKDLLQQAKMHHGLAMAYERMLQPHKSRRHFERALALYSLESDLSAIYRVENDLGYALLRQGELGLAEQHLQKALAGVDDLRIDRRGRGFVLNNLAEVNLRKGRLDSASEFVREAMAAGEETGEQVVLAEAHALSGELAQRMGDTAAADSQFGVALEILGRLDMPDRLRDCHMQYAELLSARDDIVAAARHWKLAAEVGRLAAAGLKVAEAEEETALPAS